MIHKSTMPNLVIKNPFGEKAVIVNKISGTQKMKYAFKVVSAIVLSLGLYCSYSYVKVIMEENAFLQQKLTQDIAQNSDENDNKLLLSFSEIIQKEGSIEKDIAQNYAKWIFESAYKEKIDPSLLLAIISVESKFDYQAISNANAVGLMQIIYSWHKEKVKNKVDLYDPETNIKIGAKIIREYLDRSSNTVEALLRYNGSLGQSPIYSMKVIETQKRYNFQIMKKLSVTT